MESINAEWDVIQLLEDELENRNKPEKFKHQLNRLKNLAHTIQGMIDTKEPNHRYIYKGTTILCKHLGALWREVFNMKES